MLLNLGLPEDVTVEAGAPQEIWIILDIFPSSLAMNITLQLFNKVPTRFPEAMFFRFIPPFSGNPNSWKMSKLGTAVDPTRVIVGGNQHMHTISGALMCDGGVGVGCVCVEPLDSPLVVFGKPSGFPTPTDESPDFGKGGSFVLWNNIWNTNYPLWYPFNPEDANLQYRYRVTLN